MKKLLMALGVVLLVLVVVAGAGIAYVAWTGGRLDSEGKLYADDVIPAITGEWNLALLEQREAPETKSAVPDARWEKIFAKLKTLGSLKAYHGAKGSSLVSFINGTKTITGNYTADAEFQNGNAQIQIGLIKHGNDWQILRFVVTSPYFLDTM